jgi:dienelactone hydrolase
MRALVGLSFILLLLPAGFAQVASPTVPRTVEFPSGQLHLKGYLWKPAGTGPFPAVLFNHGSGGATANLTAGMEITVAAKILAPFFVRHGYAFFYPFRRGAGLSADQAPFVQNVLNDTEKAKGKDARQHLQFVLQTTEQLDDVMAALAFLKTVPGIDARHIAVAGHSFGGPLSLFAAERDPNVRAVITFAAAANSWERSPELRDHMLKAAGGAHAAVMLVYAQNDYSTAPGTAIADELQRLHRPHLLRIYPAVGLAPEDGHSLLYEDIPAWEEDVFKFLDQYVKR